MLIKEITVQECEEFLGRIGFGRLACVHDNEPYVVPVYFAYERERLYGFSTFGQKIEWMRANPRVCVEADEVMSNNRWTCVIVSGRYEELSDAPEFASKRRQAQESLGERFRWWQREWQPAYAAEQVRHANKPSPAIVYCIHVTGMTGRSAVPDPVAWEPG
jgi:nitroimidazol reductase NimA-like FMN-containing flavoprotein (pyridoxamine 5'-phosphate oxidase superfamily)